MSDEPTADVEPERAGGSRRPLFIAGGVVVVAVVAFLAFGVFGVHKAFIDDKVSEAGPIFASGASAPTAGGGSNVPVSEGEASPGGPAVETVGAGSFEPRGSYDGEGTVTLLTDGNQTFVRFEDDFSTSNGPDLFAVVYVGGELIELEPLKGNVGAQNYELPPDIDPTTVETVAVWCKRFDSTFAEAAIA